MQHGLRIGTWNLSGRCDDRHRKLLLAQDCDIWLLTEVPAGIAVEGYYAHVTAEMMCDLTIRKHYAGILTREPATALPDPHPASAAIELGNVTYCSTVLPWQGSGGYSPWAAVPENEALAAEVHELRTWSATPCEQSPHADRTANALARLLPELRGKTLVWGGDWNHALVGLVTAGSGGGLCVLRAAIAKLRLRVPTTFLLHYKYDCTIDHIAVPESWNICGSWWVDATRNGKPLSDDHHDAYVIHVIPA